MVVACVNIACSMYEVCSKFNVTTLKCCDKCRATSQIGSVDVAIRTRQQCCKCFTFPSLNTNLQDPITMLPYPIAPVSDSSAAKIEGGGVKNGTTNEVLRMRSPIVENVRTSSDIVLVTSRGLQLPYRKKTKMICCFAENRYVQYFSVYLRRHALFKWTLPYDIANTFTQSFARHIASNVDVISKGISDEILQTISRAVSHGKRTLIVLMQR